MFFNSTLYLDLEVMLFPLQTTSNMHDEPVSAVHLAQGITRTQNGHLVKTERWERNDNAQQASESKTLKYRLQSMWCACTDVEDPFTRVQPHFKFTVHNMVLVRSEGIKLRLVQGCRPSACVRLWRSNTSPLTNIRCVEQLAADHDDLSNHHCTRNGWFRVNLHSVYDP